MKSITRRNFLRSSGALLALPALGASAAKSKAPVRFVGMYHTNGVNPYKWFPITAGPDYEMPENVALLSDLRDDTTMISGAAHSGEPTIDIVSSSLRSLDSPTVPVRGEAGKWVRPRARRCERHT